MNAVPGQAWARLACDAAALQPAEGIAVEVVEGGERVSEIARMLGGEKITSVVRKHAQELLELSS